MSHDDELYVYFRFKISLGTYYILIVDIYFSILWVCIPTIFSCTSSTWSQSNLKLPCSPLLPQLLWRLCYEVINLLVTVYMQLARHIIKQNYICSINLYRTGKRARIHSTSETSGGAQFSIDKQPQFSQLKCE